jgi:hypothetical protein
MCAVQRWEGGREESSVREKKRKSLWGVGRGAQCEVKDLK